ncbi:MAG: MFS transporter [Chloroflexota bacterium]
MSDPSPAAEAELAVAPSTGLGGRWAGRDAATLARLATIIVFMTHGLVFASWTAQIPLVKSNLGLTDAELGLALFGAPIGSIVAMLATSALLPRLGSRRMVQICLTGYCATAWTVGVAANGPQLFLALMLWGVFLGSLDVCMNGQAVFVERAVGRPIMSSFHGLWSVGAFIGVGIGALCVALGVPLAAQLATLGLVAFVVAGSATRRMLSDPPHDHATGPKPSAARAWRNPVVLLLGAVMLAALLCEGAAADWSAVYLHDSVGTSPAFAALGYMAFSVTMVVGRLSGDRLLARFAPRTLLATLALVATIGMSLALLIGGPVISLVGFAALGVGIALVVPAAFTAGGRLDGVHPGAAVAVISSVGFVGFVMGPPLIGHLADAVGLGVALALLPILTAVIAIVVRSNHAFTPGPAPATPSPAPGPTAA